jgi:hypothetical protein
MHLLEVVSCIKQAVAVSGPKPLDVRWAGQTSMDESSVVLSVFAVTCPAQSEFEQSQEKSLRGNKCIPEVLILKPCCRCGGLVSHLPRPRAQRSLPPPRKQKGKVKHSNAPIGILDGGLGTISETLQAHSLRPREAGNRPQPRWL